MANPLVMLGPGGDYVTRFDIKGEGLVRTVGQTLGQQPDTETAGGFAGYSRQPRRRGQSRLGEESANTDHASHREADRFEHTPFREGVGLYRARTLPAPAAGGADRRAAVSDHQTNASAQASMVTCIEVWLVAQQRALTEIARMLRVTFALPLESQAASRPSAQATRTTIAPALARSHARMGVGVISRPASAAHAHAHSAAPLTATLSETDHDEPHAQAAAYRHADSRPAHSPRLFTHYAGIGGRAGREQGDRLRARGGLDQEGRPLAASQQGTLFGG